MERLKCILIPFVRFIIKYCRNTKQALKHISSNSTYTNSFRVPTCDGFIFVNYEHTTYNVLVEIEDEIRLKCRFDDIDDCADYLKRIGVKPQNIELYSEFAEVHEEVF